jgi:hypothetical protein
MNKETLRMQMLAGIITESKYKQLLEDMEVIDRILDKISSQGKDSLTPEEKEYLDKYSKGETDLTEPSDDVEKQDTTPPNLKMVKDDYNSRKDELKAMGKERNLYAQAFAKWAKTQIKNASFGSPTSINIILGNLFGITKYSSNPYSGGKIKNSLPIEILEDWKSKNDPRYIGLLVYIGRVLDPEPRRY